MIQSEYGWTDDQVLDLTLGRFVFAIRVIAERKREEQEQFLVALQEHARSIVGAMPGLAFSKKAAQAIRRYAQQIQLVGRKPRRRIPSMGEVAGWFPEARNADRR